MSAPMVGFDLVEPSQIAKMLEKRVREDLFLPGEVAYSESQHDPAQSFASRYAAKEAIVKALGVDGWDPLEIEIVGGGESTSVRLRGEILERAEELGVDVTISMTHLPSIAGAVALAIPKHQLV